MSTITLLGYFTGYALQAPHYTLLVSTAATIGAGGVMSDITNNYTVINSGRIGDTDATYGVLIYRGGTVINNLGASIGGVTGVNLGTGYEGRGTHTSFGSVTNDGTILGGIGDGIYLGENLLQGGFVTNGGTSNTAALIRGANGIDDVAGIFATIAATISNFGTIQGTGDAGFAGILMDDGTPSTIVNGSSLDTAALISGYIGVDGVADGPMVLRNFGTIEGTGTTAVLLGSSADTLIDEAHAVFIGTVNGAGGTLELAGDAGAGTLTGIGTSFTNFSNVSISSGATWTLTGANTIASGATLTDDGTLIDTGSISGGINLAANGALLSITPAGTVSNAATGSAVYSRYGVNVVNEGTIDVQAPSPSAAGYYGVHLANGGSVDNSGTIIGNNFAGLRILGGVSVTNSGLIASGRAGVFADFGVSIDNTGRIHGPVNGVFARNGSATISNTGTIYGNNAIWVLNGIGTITNSGTLQGLADRAVSLTAGGTVTNQAGGLITAPGNNVAIYIGGANYTATASGVVTNAGTIAAGTGIAFYAGDTLSQTVIDSGTIIGSSGTAIAFGAGNDTLRLQPSTSAFIQGVVDGGGGTNTLAFTSGATTGTLTGIGADFVNFTEAAIDAGASWMLAGSDTFASGGTLINAGTLTINGRLTNNGSFIVTGSVLNAGTIDGNPPGDIVIDMRAGSSLTNQAGGLIDGSGEGILLQGGGTVLNAGSIGGSGTGVYVAGGSLTNQSGGTISGYQGVYASGAARVVNAGRISGDIDSPVGYAVVLLDGGRITNQAGGVINGYRGINAILDPATVANAGSVGGNMTGARGAGVFLFQGGAVTNQSGGVISGDRGVVALYADATVVNAGTIDGNPSGGFGIALLAGGSITNQAGGTISGGAGAVTLAAGQTNRVVIDPGAVFIGAVDGGNTIGATAVSTLELASAAGAGTLTGLGSQFIDFTKITIDSGASWVLTGGNTIGAGVNLLDGGALTVAGSLVNDGAATLSSSLVVTGTLRNVGSIDVASYRALELSSGSYLYNAAGATIARGSSGPAFDPTVFAMGGGAVAIRNLGTITDAPGDITLDLSDGGTITNGSTSDTTALIEGEVGVYIDAGRGIVTNFGTIETSAYGGPGIELNQGGNIINGASGSTAASILGAQYGVFGVYGPTTLTNFGTIAASDNGFGFYQRFGTATVFNAGVIGATNGSGVGVALQGGGTVVDSGTIAGANTAVRFGGTGSNVLVLEHGYAFFGLIQGSASASNTLELVGSVGAAVTVKYLEPGVGLVNFQTVEFGPGAGNAATLDINNGAELPGTIAGFVGVHDTIDLTALSDIGNNATTSFNALTDVLTVTGDNGSVALQLDGEDYAGLSWAAQNDGAGGTAVHVVPIVPPVISGTVAGQATSDETAIQPFGFVTIDDSNQAPEAETLTITLTHDGVATDADGTLAGVGLSETGTGTGTYTLFASSPEAATAELQALAFTPTAHQVAPGNTVTTDFTISVTDSVGASTSDGSTTVTATAANDPPVISGVTPGLTTTDEAPATAFASVGISDVDLGQTETVTITLSSAANGALSNFGTGSYDGTTGVYTVTGTDAEVTAAVDALVFTPTAHQVAPGGTVTTGFTIKTSDTAGGIASDATTSVAAVAVSDSPVITGTTASQATTDATTLAPFSTVSISDVDFGQTETVTIALSSTANGSLSKFGTGSYDGATGVYSVTGTDAEVTAAVDALVFTPTAHQVAPAGTVTTGFTITVADSAGASSTDTITSVVTTAVSDAPLISGTEAGQTTTDAATTTPFAGVGIGDVDTGQTETVTVTLSTAANGTLSNLAGGSYDSKTGVYTVTGSDAAVTAAVDGLVFTPTAHQVAPGDSVTTGFTISVADTAGATTSDAVTTVAATAQNDPPLLTAAPVLAGVPNQTATAPFAGLTITDPDVGHIDTLTVTLSNAAGGSLSNPGGGSYDTATGVYSVTGTLTDVTTALRGLVFTPAPLAGGLVDTTGFTVVISGPGGSASDSGFSITSVQQVLTLAAEPTSDDVISVSPDGSGFAPPTPDKTNEAVISNPIDGATYTLPTGYQAAFLGGSANATLIDPTGGNTLLAGNIGNDLLLSGAANDTILAGSGQSTIRFTSDASAGVAFGGTGSVAILDAGRNDTLAGASGTTTATLSGSGAVFFGEAGATTILNAGAGSTLDGGSGPSTFQLTSGATSAVVFGGLSSATISDAGSNDTIAGASGATAATLSGSTAVFFGQAGDVTLVDTGSSDTIAGGTGAMAVTSAGSGGVVFGGSGSLSFVGGTSGATIAAGTGAVSVAGGSGGTTLFGGSGGAVRYAGGAGSLLYAAGAGSETLDASGSSTANQMFGGLDRDGRDLIIGGAGNDTLVAGSGSDTLAGGVASHDVFVFFSVNGGANDLVANFSANDTVLLAGYGGGAAASALSGATSSNGSTTITLSDNTRITFSDIASVSSLAGHLVST